MWEARVSPALNVQSLPSPWAAAVQRGCGPLEKVRVGPSGQEVPEATGMALGVPVSWRTQTRLPPQVLELPAEPGGVPAQLHEIHHQPVVSPFPVHRRLCPSGNAALRRSVSAQQLLLTSASLGSSPGPPTLTLLTASRDPGPPASHSLPSSWPG